MAQRPMAKRDRFDEAAEAAAKAAHSFITERFQCRPVGYDQEYWEGLIASVASHFRDLCQPPAVDWSSLSNEDLLRKASEFGIDIERVAAALGVEKPPVPATQREAAEKLKMP